MKRFGPESRKGKRFSLDPQTGADGLGKRSAGRWRWGGKRSPGLAEIEALRAGKPDFGFTVGLEGIREEALR